MYIVADVQTYDYALTNWFMEGLFVTIDAPDSYPQTLTQATLLSPGTNNMLRLQLTKTFTTDTALGKPPETR